MLFRSKGQVQFNVTAKATDPDFPSYLTASGLLQGDPSIWKMTVLTPSTCTLKPKVGVLYGQSSITAFIVPVAVGTCSVKFDFAGIPGLKVDGSTFTWSATVNR